MGFGFENISETVELYEGKDLGKITSQITEYQAQLEEANRQGFSAAENYLRNKIDRLSGEYAEQFEKEQGKPKPPSVETAGGTIAGSSERGTLSGKLSFGGETIYEKKTRQAANEKVHREKKIDSKEKKTYLDNHPHPTIHELKKLDELSKKK